MHVPLTTSHNNMERGNKKNKRGRGSEGPGGGCTCGDHHHHHMENIWRSKSKKSKYEDEPRWCMDCLGSSFYNTKNGNSISRYDICSEEEQKVELGVFEFPWLKDDGEGVIFKGNDLCQATAGMGLLEEDKYAFALTALHHDHLHHFTTTTSSSSFQMDNLCSSSLPFHHAHDNPNKIFEGSPPRPLSSFKVDSNNIDQQMECIWSSVLDQPLDINLNII